MAEPPLCSWLDIDQVTLNQLLDMHEALDFKAAQIDKQRKVAERK